ncbi:MAG: alpha/beta fold hydrolase [Pseudomonadota bacterium]
MPILDRADGSIHYEAIDLVPPWVADPQAILFHHGLGTTSGIWSDWLPPLADRFRLVRFDLRGFGHSSVPPAGFPWSLELLAEDTLAVAKAAGLSRFHFVGESLGGIMGYYLAIHRPEVLLTMTSCTASHRGSRIEGGIDTWGDLVATSGMAGWSRMMMDSRFRPGAISQAAYEWFDREQAASPAHANLEASRMLRQMDLAGDLGRITTPTLLIVGEASPFVPVDMVCEIRSMIKGAELQVVAGARHGVVFSHARQCATVLRDFIARHPAA